jgi:methanogenic corrinoid protein MtbC1
VLFRSIEVLKGLKRLTEEGVVISDAVRLLPELKKNLNHAPPEPVKADVSQVARWQTRVLEAAARMDQREVGAVLDEALSALPPLAAFSQVIVPIQREVGERWHQGTLTVAEEHLVTHEVRVRLLSLIHGAPLLDKKHVVCACFPEENHEVGLLGAALRFLHAGFRVTYLGPLTPLDELITTVRRVMPNVVALSCVNDAGKKSFRSTLKAVVEEIPTSVQVLVGGRVAVMYQDVAEGLGVNTIAVDTDWNQWL